MSRGALFYFMVPLLALAALLQSAAGSRLAFNGVKPDLTLLIVLVGTLIYGPRAGVVWAFTGGIFLDVFSGGPMGASSLALMAAALVAGAGHRTLSRFNLFVPLGAAVLGTLAYGLTYLSVLAVVSGLAVTFGLDILHHDLPFWPTVEFVLLPAVLYNAILMLLALPLLNRMPESQEAVTTFQ